MVGSDQTVDVGIKSARRCERKILPVGTDSPPEKEAGLG
jgi:hypothetical protein